MSDTIQVSSAKSNPGETFNPRVGEFYSLSREQGPIPRSSKLERTLFLARAAHPKLTSPMRKYIPFILSPGERDMLGVKKLMLDNSKTFAFALRAMAEDSGEIADDIALMHQGFKMADFFEEDKTLATATNRDAQIDIMRDFFDAIKYPNPNKVYDLQQRINTLAQADTFDPEFESLSKNIALLTRAFRSRQEVRDIFLKYAERMAKGFTDPEVQKVRTMQDVDRYCYYAAVLVGDAVQDVLHFRKYLTDEQFEALKLPARRMGKGVQMGNNLRDIFKDFREGLWRWPREYIEPLVAAETPEEVQDAYANQFSYLKDQTSKVMLEAVDYVDSLPADRIIGPRVFGILGLGAYATVVGRLGKEFVQTKGEYKKPGIGDALELRDIARHLARNNQSSRPLLESLLNGIPPQDFRR